MNVENLTEILQLYGLRYTEYEGFIKMFSSLFQTARSVFKIIFYHY